jgi:enamine deaminase RidA (YjgF/YER057c/UK114 family)
MKLDTCRRRFLRDGVLIGIGASTGALLPTVVPVLSPQSARADDEDETATGAAETRLRELGIELPPPPKPVAVYIPAVRVGNTLYASGHGPRRLDGTSVQGKVGQDLTLEQGYEAARIVGLNVLSSVRHTLGSLDNVVRLVKVLGMVNCASDFTKQPQVINGFSELMVQVFGEKTGKGARSAVGMGSLPGNIAVEIEAIFEVRG